MIPPPAELPQSRKKLLHEQRGGVCPRHFPSLTLHSSTLESVNPEGIPYFSPATVLVLSSIIKILQLTVLSKDHRF